MDERLWCVISAVLNSYDVSGCCRLEIGVQMSPLQADRSAKPGAPAPAQQQQGRPAFRLTIAAYPQDLREGHTATARRRQG